MGSAEHCVVVAYARRVVVDTRFGVMTDNPRGRCQTSSARFWIDARGGCDAVRHDLVSYRSHLDAQLRKQPLHILYSGAAEWRDAVGQRVQHPCSSARSFVPASS